MNYTDTLKYMYNRLPMFYRMGAAALKPNLDNIIALCEQLGNPQSSFKSLHIAGTNGKGSTSHMLASIFQENGYQTGLYTSPHLKDFRERIRINGKMISRGKITDFIQRNKSLIEVIQPSFFEMTVVLAFEFFKEQGVEYAIIETGLGGRLDSTNIIHSVLSIITNISWDHMDVLGNSLELIASEKAGIIKTQTPIIISERQNEVESIFIDQAGKLNAPLSFASDHWNIQNLKSHQGYQEMDLTEIQTGKTYTLHLDLPGIYQVKNIKGIFETLKVLRSKGVRIEPDKAIHALRYVKKNTGLRGRWDLLSRHPLIICDTGHNLEGMTEVVRQINITPHEKLHFVFGVVKDKDLSSILAILPLEAEYYFCKADIPRALESDQLKLQAASYGLKGRAYSSVKEALHSAKRNAGKNDLIFIGGSTFVVAEIIP